MGLLKRIAQNLQSEDENFPHPPGFRGRHIYDDQEGNGMMHRAWEFANRHFPPEILDGLCQDQNIQSMLAQVDDLGEFTREEWEKFFERIRVEGI